jgi:DNA-directed RNA polymerase specialized sigma24 family protein
MHRVTVEEAARLLGIEKESVRKRVYRGCSERIRSRTEHYAFT